MLSCGWGQAASTWQHCALEGNSWARRVREPRDHRGPGLLGPLPGRQHGSGTPKRRSAAQPRCWQSSTRQQGGQPPLHNSLTPTAGSGAMASLLLFDYRETLDQNWAWVWGRAIRFAVEIFLLQNEILNGNISLAQ